MRYCQWLYRLQDRQQEDWGKEAVDLAKVGRTGAAIVPGFSCSQQLYADFFVGSKLEAQLKYLAADLNFSDWGVFSPKAKELREAVRTAGFSKSMQKDLTEYFAELEGSLLKKKKTGIRLVLTAQSAGLEQVTVVAKEAIDLENAVKQLYALMFTDSLFAERLSAGGSIILPAFAILIEVVEKPVYSGQATTHDPNTLDDTTIVIQAVHQEAQAEVAIDDIYRVDRKTLTLLSRHIRKQWWAEDHEGRHISPPHLGAPVQTLNDEQIIQLSRQIKMAYQAFLDPQRFRWVYVHRQFMISRVEPLLKVEVTPPSDLPVPLLLGLPGAVGQVSGVIRLIKTKAHRAYLQPGEIAVVEQLSKKDYLWLEKTRGLISETGTGSSIEGVAARHLGIPAVVGTGRALTDLKDGQVVTLDGGVGAVYAGDQPVGLWQQQGMRVYPATGTKLYASVPDPQKVHQGVLDQADGIGLLRSEFLLELLGTHPQEIIRKKLQEEFVEILTESLEQALSSIHPRPVIYQLHDPEPAYLGRHQRHEPNPAIGYRGAHRLLQEPEVLELELAALSSLAAKGYHNLQVMMPMTRTLEEVDQMLKFLAKSHLAKIHPVRLWIKCETPSLTIVMQELCQRDIAGVCFDAPKLAQLILGVDQANRQIAHTLDQSNQAVLDALQYAIATCKEHGVATSVTAEMESLRPEVVETAVLSGVTAVVVEPEQLSEMRGLIVSIERQADKKRFLQE